MSIEPVISANSTVSCLRSSSSSAFGLVTGSSGLPHSEPHLAEYETRVPQLAHHRPSGAAHSSQNFALSAFSCWQFAHFIFGGRKPGRCQTIPSRPPQAVVSHQNNTIDHGAARIHAAYQATSSA